MSQQHDALQVANARKRERARLRRDLAAGTVSRRDVLLDPPACVHELLLSEFLLLLPGLRRRSVETLGREAHYAGITLTVQVGRSSKRTREWVAEHARHGVASGRSAVPGHGSPPAMRVIA